MWLVLSEEVYNSCKVSLLCSKNWPGPVSRIRRRAVQKRIDLIEFGDQNWR